MAAHLGREPGTSCRTHPNFRITTGFHLTKKKSWWIMPLKLGRPWETSTARLIHRRPLPRKNPSVLGQETHCLLQRNWKKKTTVLVSVKPTTQIFLPNSMVTKCSSDFLPAHSQVSLVSLLCATRPPKKNRNPCRREHESCAEYQGIIATTFLGCI